MSIFQRLKQERERLELSQTALGTLTNVGKTTVINWEKGASAPDAIQLGVMAANGFDVLFVLTGQRSQALPPSATLPPVQRALLTSFEMCVPEAQQQLLQLAAMLAAGLQTNTGSNNQINSGAGAVQIRGSSNLVRPRPRK